MNIILIGPQGAGKGTQATRLSAYLGIPTISTGALFRAEIARGTGLGRAVDEYIKKGEMVPPETVNQMMHERLNEDDALNGVILDGYPRTPEQAKNLDEFLRESGRAVTHVLLFKVSDEVGIQRAKERHRADDTLEVIRHRLELYHKSTEPIIQYYRERGILVEVNGERSIDEVEQEIRVALGV